MAILAVWSEEMITSFHLMWMDCSCHSVDSISTEKTTVHRKHCNIMCAQHDGHNQVLKSVAAQMELPTVEKLFKLMDSLVSDLKSNGKQFDIQVCDGSRWVLRIHNSDHSVQKYEETVYYPDSVKHITEILLNALQFIDIQPMLFGWSPEEE